MEKFVNDVVFKLHSKFSVEEINIIKQVLYSVSMDYKIEKRSTELATVSNYPKEIQIYLVSRKIDCLSDNTIAIYKYSLERFFGYIDKPIAKIKTEDLRIAYYSLRKESKMGNRSMENQRMIVGTFFRWLFNNDYISKNPHAVITKFKYERKERKALSDLELERLRKACSNSRERAMFEVMFSSGCRVSELVALKISDLNFETKEITILHGKGDKDRTTYFNAPAFLAIQEYLDEKDYVSEYVFTSTRKEHGCLCTRTVQAFCQKLTKKTGIYLHPHKMRRTVATHLLKKGMALEKIQVLLGHEDINTTLQYAKIDLGSVKADYQKYM